MPETNRADQAAQTLDALANEFCRGEKAFLGHALRCGQLCHEYVCQRRGMRHSRANAVKTIAGRLAEAGITVDCNRYIAAYWVSQLLGEGIDFSAMPFSVLREFNTLLKRNNKDETWTVRPGLEEQARALFRQVAEQRTDAEAVGEAARKLRGKEPRGDDDPPDGNARRDEVVRALPDVARRASPQDLADCLAGAVAVSPDPAAVLQHLARRLGWQPDWGTALAMGLRAGGHAKAANALLLVLRQWQRKAS